MHLHGNVFLQQNKGTWQRQIMQTDIHAYMKFLYPGLENVMKTTITEWNAPYPYIPYPIYHRHVLAMSQHAHTGTYCPPQPTYQHEVAFFSLAQKINLYDERQKPPLSRSHGHMFPNIKHCVRLFYCFIHELTASPCKTFCHWISVMIHWFLMTSLSF